MRNLQTLRRLEAEVGARRHTYVRAQDRRASRTRPQGGDWSSDMKKGRWAPAAADAALVAATLALPGAGVAYAAGPGGNVTGHHHLDAAKHAAGQRREPAGPCWSPGSAPSRSVPARSCSPGAAGAARPRSGRPQ